MATNGDAAALYDGSKVIEIAGAGRNDDPWIVTASGKKFHMLNPRPEDIDIDDIAHALGMQCRFTGHTKNFYSVAEHSVHVASVVYQETLSSEHALRALLHDASEAYLTDMHRPAKVFTEIGPPYLRVEEKIQRAISSRFGIEYGMTPEIKYADNLLLGVEGRELVHDIDSWTASLPKLPKLEEPFIFNYSPVTAKRDFLVAFALYGGKR